MSKTFPLRAALAALPLAGLTALGMTEAPHETGQEANAGQASAKAPPEFGDVAWGRKLEDATAKATEDGKPVMLLFQEVPG